MQRIVIASLFFYRLRHGAGRRWSTVSGPYEHPYQRERRAGQTAALISGGWDPEHGKAL